MNTLKIVSAVAVLGLGLVGCADNPMVAQKNLTENFGAKVHEAIVAQIADPDAHYVGKPDPGSDASRVALAQARYGTAAQVIKPGAMSRPLIPNGEAIGQDEYRPGLGAYGGTGGPGGFSVPQAGGSGSGGGESGGGGAPRPSPQ